MLDNSVPHQTVQLMIALEIGFHASSKLGRYHCPILLCYGFVELREILLVNADGSIYLYVSRMSYRLPNGGRSTDRPRVETKHSPALEMAIHSRTRRVLTWLTVLECIQLPRA